jgi:hypothetical protein
MKEVPVDESIREIWKKYPLRISGLKDSRCHGKPTVLVQSMDGGSLPEIVPTAEDMSLYLKPTSTCSVCGSPVLTVANP